MEEQEYESHLFIGGIVDGQWFDIPKSANRWRLPILDTRNSNIFTMKSLEELKEFVEYEEVEYHRVRLCDIPHENKVLYVFVSDDLKGNDPHYYQERNWNLMCKLVNNYKVIK